MPETATKKQVCSRCVMSTADPTVSILKDGRCNYCHDYDTTMHPKWHPDGVGAAALEKQLDELRRETADHEYQLVLGMSGGIDSSYLAVKANEWGLRVLAVHVDAGWDTPDAIENVSRLIRYCGFDYITVTPRWETIRRLQLAFLRSGVVNQDIPQDHAFFTGLYGTANKHRVRHVLSGSNIATEGIGSRAFGEGAMDSWLVRDVARRDGMFTLPGYPLIGFFGYHVVNPYIRRMTVLAPLNLMEYSRDEALSELTETVGYIDYGAKHSESYFTRFHQGYYMPTRFGIDKREAHLSSQVLSGQLGRDEALEILTRPLYEDELVQSDIALVADRLQISQKELTDFAKMPPGPTHRFVSQAGLKSALRPTYRKLKSLRGHRPGVYR